MKIVPFTKQFVWVVVKYCQKPKSPQNFKILPKQQNFAKSGHTAH